MPQMSEDQKIFFNFVAKNRLVSNCFFFTVKFRFVSFQTAFR